ncbi:Serine/threonine-protein kinase RIO1 [Meloidogyne graminicola]|uniref:Serine/threonine-protein kinase RIO1 n=1 Tax=Meloidogyne graminicola TaxID=189291 RepID=A0A8S9ZB47_9BILA|nr:Serine/threonine-protein kinase RIO1 [Meloidogyne graminicola]
MHIRSDLLNPSCDPIFEQDDDDGSGEDFEEFADDCEEFTGNLTKIFTSVCHTNYRVPNRQSHNPVSASVLRAQSLRSGEAFIQAHLSKVEAAKERRKLNDRSNRATVEQVLDPRTRLILFQLIQRGFFDTVEGCISTGKEANVYHGITENSSLAIKIYKTSILTFKDRDKYVAGEFRYRKGYCRHNPRKMVSTWAEKEIRNLQRMYLAGILVPKPILLKGHVLVMEFIGEDACPAPLLKNVNDIDAELADKLYVECVTIMRDMYRKCKLVHADLSEFNILFYDNHLVIIDVSQSVEHDHPNALTFLRSDISNITKFFMERGTKVFGMKRLFELIVDPMIDDLQFANALIHERQCDHLPDDSFFMNAYIPHKLEQIVTFERDHIMEKQGFEPNNPFQKVIGKTFATERTIEDDICSNEDDYSSSDELNDQLSDEQETDEEVGSVNKQDKKISHQLHPRLKGESNEEKKARKEAVKEEKRDQRKNKVPKKIKVIILKSMAQLDNNIMNMSMTRSIYVGTDKTAEVLKRKEAAEKDRMARCEAKMREQEERLARAKNNKENELRERIRERQQKELERQKAALDRRCAQLNKLTAKKEEILQKNHQKASRILTNRPQKKLAFVFGSSTPRELCYLEKGGQQKRSNQTLSINSRGSTPPKLNLRSEPVSSRVPSRFMTNNRVEKPVHPSDVMTRSVLGSLGSSAPTNKQQPTSPRRKPSAVKKQQSKSPIIPSTANKNNGPVSSSLMTQSLYSARPVQNGFSKSNGHSSEKKNENVSNEKTNMDLRQQRRPVIRPKVENQLMKSCNIETTISTNVQQTELDFSLLREKTFEETETFIKDKVVLTDTNDSESLLNADINNIGSSNFVSPLLEEVRPPNIHVSHVELSNTTFLISDDNKLTSLQTQMEECSSIEDRNRESILSDRTLVLSRAGRDSTNTIVDATDTTLILISEQDQRSPSSNHSSLEESEVLTPKIDRTIPPMAIPPILEENGISVAKNWMKFFSELEQKMLLVHK